MIDLHRLRVFRAVVSSGSVAAAADHLGYTPSAVSQHIAALQRETGLTLFVKSGRGITPTPVARTLLAESEDVMASLARLGGVVTGLREGRTGRVSVGTFASAAQVLLPPVAASFAREFPSVVLELGLNESSESIIDRRPDIDLRTEDAFGPATSLPGYSRIPVHEDGYRVVAPRGHEILAEFPDTVPLAALAELPWIDADLQESTCGLVLRNACRSAGFTPRYAARSDDHHTALAFVAAGVGIAVLPELAADPGAWDVQTRRVTNPEPRRRIVAFVRDDVEAQPAVRFIVEALHTAARETAAA